MKDNILHYFPLFWSHFTPGCLTVMENDLADVVSLHYRASICSSPKLLSFWERKEGCRHSHRSSILQQATCCPPVQVQYNLKYLFIQLLYLTVYLIIIFYLDYRQVEKDNPDGNSSKQVRCDSVFQLFGASLWRISLYIPSWQLPV